MCWSCSCNSLESDHGDSRTITTLDLISAADQAGTDIGHVVGNIVVGLSHFNPDMAKEAQAVHTNVAGCRVVKTTDDRRYTLGVAYPAMKADVSTAADGFRDFVSPETLEKTAWDWMTNHRAINLFHKSGDSFDGHGTVVESYIYRGPDWHVPSPVNGSTYAIKAGDWLLGAVWDSYGWTLVKSGLVNGWSPEGTASRIAVDQERLSQLRS